MLYYVIMMYYVSYKLNSNVLKVAIYIVLQVVT